MNVALSNRSCDGLTELITIEVYVYLNPIPSKTDANDRCRDSVIRPSAEAEASDFGHRVLKSV